MFRFWYRVYVPPLPETPCWARNLSIPHGLHCLEECFLIWCPGTQSQAVQKYSGERKKQHSKHFYKQGSPRWPILVIFSHHSILLTQSVLIPKPVKVNTCPDSHHKLWRFSLMLSKGTNHKSQHYGFQLIWKIFVNGDFSLNYKISTILKMFSNVKILIYLKAAL